MSAAPDSPSRGERVLGAAMWAAVLVVALFEVRLPSDGMDLHPLYSAGQAYAVRGPIYDTAHFGYPPFAAMAMAPFTALPFDLVIQLYAVIQMTTVLAGCILLGRGLFPDHALLASASITLSLLVSWFFLSSLTLFNVSFLLLLPLVAACSMWSKGRWVPGGLLIGATAAFKPLLAPLFLIPLIFRAGRAVLIGVGFAVALTAIAIFLNPDTEGLTGLLPKVMSGANDLGDIQVYNISPSSIGILYPDLMPLMTALRIGLAVGAGAAFWRFRRWSRSFPNLLVMSGVASLALPLVLTLSEVHFSVLAFPAVCVLVMGRHGVLARIAGIVGATMLCLPLAALPLGSLDLAERAQVVYGFGQVIVLVGCLIARPQPAELGSVDMAETRTVVRGHRPAA